MIVAVENAQRGDVSTQSQSVKPLTDLWVIDWPPHDSNGSTLYATKWFKLILGCTSPEMGTGLAFQMIAILTVIRNIKVQYTDTGHGYKGSVLKDWRYDK